MAVLSKTVLILALLALCLVASSAVRTCHRQKIVEKYNGNGDCIYLKRVGLLGSDGYEITFETFPLNQEYKAVYVFSGVPVNSQAYVAALKVEGCSRGFDGLDRSVLSMRLSDDTGKTYFDLEDEIGKYTHAFPPFHVYHFDRHSNPMFAGMRAEEKREYTLEVQYVPVGVSDGFENEGNFFLKTGGFK